MDASTFEDLLVWQRARKLTASIYVATKLPQYAQDVRFVGQIRSAATSVVSNIAEGFERQGRKEFQYHLNVAKGSCGEVRSQLYVALDAGYMREVEFKTLRLECVELSRMLEAFLRSVQVQGAKNGKRIQKPVQV